MSANGGTFTDTVLSLLPLLSSVSVLSTSVFSCPVLCSPKALKLADCRVCFAVPECRVSENVSGRFESVGPADSV